MKLKDTIRTGITDSFSIWRQEIHHIFSDVGVILLFVVVPLIYPILYALIYNPEVVREAPMIVVDQSNSALSREFIRKIDATPDVHINDYAADMEAARAMIDRKEGYGILFIPADFDTDISKGRQTHVSLFCDMSGMLYYKAFLLSTTEASLAMRTTINVDAPEPPVHYEEVSMYNTQSGFASFLIPSIVVLIIQQTLLIGIGMLSATTRERNAGLLVPPGAMHQGTLRMVFGKAMAYLSVYAFVSIWAMVIVPRLFALPQLAYYWNLLLFSLPLLLACIFFAMTVASFVRGRETSMMIFVFTSLPILFLSGVSWPASALPEYWKYISYLFPSTFGIQGFVKLNTMGAALNDVAFEYHALWLQTGIYFISTFLIYRHNIAKTEKALRQEVERGHRKNQEKKIVIH